MAMERGRFAHMNEAEVTWIETCMRYNISQAGKDNHPQPLLNFQYGIGFLFELPNGTLWRVRKVFPKEQQAFVTSVDGNHAQLWNPTRRVKVPQLYLETHV